MGVSYFTCKACGDAFPDCGDYIRCEGCGSEWCSDECAEADGYKEAVCKLGKDVDTDGYCDEDCELLKEGSHYCVNCSNFTETSCNYCNGTDMSDSDIVSKLMKQHGFNDRKKLIKFLFREEDN